MAGLTLTLITFLLIILSLIMTMSTSSSSSQILNVSSSLNLIRHIFEPHKTQLSTTDSNNNSNSFSLNLHPRSSLPLALLDSDNNYTALVLSRLKRDESRMVHLLARSKPEQLEAPLFSGLGQGSGEYFARIGLGQPARDFFTIVDTGSDVTWIQCSPCSTCYQQSDPIFDPRYSSTYTPLPCGSLQCESLRASACRVGACIYQVSYADGSYSAGTFAAETVSFGSSGSVPGVAVGCGTDNQGMYGGAAGVLGLGGGPLSLPSQIRAASFSYCLVNMDSRSSSTLDFDSVRPGDSVVAPLVTSPFISTFRYVGFAGIVVAGRPVAIPAGVFQLSGDGSGGVILDSGTSVTRFPASVYVLIRDAFASVTRDLPPAAGFSLFDTCYDLSGRTGVVVPTVSFQFSGGETLPLAAVNYLIPVDERGTFCFAFAGTSDSMSIIGNVQQQGTRVSYDLANRYIAFSPNKC